MLSSFRIWSKQRSVIARLLALPRCSNLHSDHSPSTEQIRVVSRQSGKKEDLWQLYNEVVYPPLSSTISPLDAAKVRPGEVTHRRVDIVYSQKKLWYLGFMIRGMSIDDAFAQLGFRPEKGARIIEEVLEEAVDIAVRDHDFEYCTKIWIENVHVSRGRSVPRVRKGNGLRLSISNYHYANLFVRLQEGEPPAVYHPRRVSGAWTPAHNCPANGRPFWGSTNDILQRELVRIRQRKLKLAL